MRTPDDARRDDGSHAPRTDSAPLRGEVWGASTVADDALVLAPFVRVESEGASSVRISRIDPGPGTRIAIRGSQRLVELLRRLESPRPRSAVARGPSEEQAIEALRRARMLVPLPTSAPSPAIELEITNRCNAACIMCPREELRPLGAMSREVLERVLALVERHPERGVGLQGIGEPTLHPELREIVASLRAKLGAAPILMVTNGLLLTPERLGALRDAGLSHVQWSFHSADRHTYDAIMGVPAFDRVCRNLEACIEAHAEILSINVVLLERNAEQVGALRKWLAARGITDERIHLIPCFSRGGLVDVGRLGTGRSSDSVGRCLYVRKSLFIAWNGDLLPCSNDIAGGHVYANVLRDSPEEIAARWRDRLLVRGVDFAMCRACDHHTRGTLPTQWFDALDGAPIEPER
jgi:hypothetical protein